MIQPKNPSSALIQLHFEQKLKKLKFWQLGKRFSSQNSIKTYFFHFHWLTCLSHTFQISDEFKKKRQKQSDRSKSGLRRQNDKDAARPAQMWSECNFYGSDVKCPLLTRNTTVIVTLRTHRTNFIDFFGFVQLFLMFSVSCRLKVY
jgi:hypothetical protein